MNKPNINNLLKNKIGTLSGAVREIFNSEEVANILSDIAEKNGLDEKQAITLFNEIGYVLFKVTAISQFRSEIEKSLGIDSGVALGISSEVYGTVFLPIKKYLAETPEDIPEIWKNYKDESVSYDQTPNITSESSTSEDASLNEALNPNDIIREIESPTPSISISAPIKVGGGAKDTAFNSNSTELDLDALELPGKTLKIPETEIATTQKSPNSSSTSKTQNAPGSAQTPVSRPQDIQLQGFAPIDNSVHPAQKTADKLQNALTQPTKTQVKEVYQVKSPDPYREPFI